MSALTIPLPEIIKKLAVKVSCDDEIAGAFLREFSTVVTQGLAADGAVSVAGLGTFRVIADIEGKSTVDFAPERLLADKLNEPFAIFDSVEVADSVTDDELESAPSLPDSPKEETPPDDVSIIEADAVAEEPQPTPPPLPPRFSKKVEKTEAAATQPAAPQPSRQTRDDEQQEQQPLSRQPDSPPCHEPQPACAPFDSPVAVRLEPESRVTIKRVGHTTLTLVVTAIAACLLGIVFGYIAYRYANYGLPSNVEVIDGGILIRHADPNSLVERGVMPFEQKDSVSTRPEAANAPESIADSLAESSIASLDGAVKRETAAVTDTVRPGNYLSVMARHHYGNAKFWVYIYLENKEKIKDPDNLENGMVLVIPPASKYDIDPADPASLKRADREAYKAMSE